MNLILSPRVTSWCKNLYLLSFMWMTAMIASVGQAEGPFVHVVWSWIACMSIGLFVFLFGSSEDYKE